MRRSLCVPPLRQSCASSSERSSPSPLRSPHAYADPSPQYVQTPKGTPKNHFQIWQVLIENSKHQRNSYRPLHLRGVGSGSAEPLDGDRLARWARIGAGRLGGVPVTR